MLASVTGDTMSFTCELSGESLLTVQDAVVVTPSGHLCRRNLLLQKLAENGGIDPFHTERPLQEDELVELQHPAGNKVAVPPRNQTNHSMSSTLHQLQQEYDAVILELFDTRKVLEETRKELSLALYQNDAAVRVVARVAAERDQAVAAVRQWNGVAKNTNANAPASPRPEHHEPATKKAKVDHVNSVIPEDDLGSMLAVWEELHQARKAQQKKAAKEARTVEELGKYALLKQKGSKLPALSSCDHGAAVSTALAATKEQKVVQVSSNSREILVYTKSDAGAWALSTVGTLSCACVGGSIDIQGSTVVAGLSNGSVDVVNVTTGDTVGTCIVVADGAVVDVRLHPDGKHFVAATSNGRVVLGRTGDLTVAAQFEQPGTSYSAGALHPDGLIYIVGDIASGNLLLWDFKSQSLAGTLSPVTSSVVKAVEFSNNGYHIAAAYETGDILVWDLRKQAVLATLNNGDDKLDSILSVKFDDSGKYLAYSGSRGSDSLVVRLTTVKEWGSTTTLHDSKSVVSAGLVWGESWIASSATKSNRKKTEPHVAFFGI